MRSAGLLLAGFVAFAALALPGAASADDPPCASPLPIEVDSRPIVPVGVSAARIFSISIDSSTKLSNVRFFGPPDYKSETLTAGDYGLRVTAPSAGPFTVQGAWTETFTDYSVSPSTTLTCTGGGSVGLTAVAGMFLKLKSPKQNRTPGFRDEKARYRELVWRYKCRSDSNSAPLSVRVRYEVKTKGGLSKRSPSFTVTAEDPCDPLADGYFKQQLPQGAKLALQVGGGVSAGHGQIGFDLELPGSFFKFPSRLRLGIKVRQGTHTLVNKKFCAGGGSDFWDQTRNCRIPRYVST